MQASYPVSGTGQMVVGVGGGGGWWGVGGCGWVGVGICSYWSPVLFGVGEASWRGEALKVTVVETTEYLVNFMQIFILYYCHGDFQRYLHCFGQIWSLFFGQVWTMVSTANQIKMTE